MEKDNIYRISIWGEFIDKDLEKEFFNNYMDHTLKYMKPVILSLGILYMLFIIPDYFIIKNPENFIFILINRILFLALIIILLSLVKTINDYSKLAACITIYEVLGVLFFISVLLKYESPNFFIQAFGVMVIILGIFLAPNKWINTIAASIIASMAFFISSSYYFSYIKPMEFYSGIVYIFVVIFLSGAASHRINYYNRKQFAYNRELLMLSERDSLTGIYNKSKFNEELEKWIEYSKRYGTTFSLIIFDFDDFKKINDTYGHSVGDKVLIETINLIKRTIRNTDILARWGGEEFVLLLPETERKQALALTERLRVLIANNSLGYIGYITCSFGLAMFREYDNNNTLLNLADKLLYKAKNSGKNNIVAS